MGTLFLSQAAIFCPSPLHIHKRRRRLTFRRQQSWRPTHTKPTHQYAHGPLDDFIDEIACNIWHLPLEYGLELQERIESAAIEETLQFAIASTTPSRSPTKQTLNIRKNRIKCSLTSGASMGVEHVHSTGPRQDRPRSTGSESDTTLSSGENNPPVTFHPLHNRVASDPVEAAGLSATTAAMSFAQQSFDLTIPQEIQPNTQELRPEESRFRSIFRAFRIPHWRRAFSGPPRLPSNDPPRSGSDTPEVAAIAAYLAQYGREYDFHAMDSLLKHLLTSHSPTRVAALISRVRPLLNDDTESTSRNSGGMPMVPTLVAGIKIIPEVKFLSSAVQEFGIAIEIEGLIANHRLRPASKIDVVFLVDNGYYVTQNCLERAVEAVNEGYRYLRSGDRVALYTTQSTQNEILGDGPEVYVPLSDYKIDRSEGFRASADKLSSLGPQSWYPVRPNISMTEAVMSVAQSLGRYHWGRATTHLIVLSPAAYVLHGLSGRFPNLHIHRVNPAVLPYRRHPELKDTICFRNCCENVFVHGGECYQPIACCIKRIFRIARSEKPSGEIFGLDLQLHMRPGCELLDSEGSPNIPYLRLGEVYHHVLRVRVHRDQLLPLELQSSDAILNSNLDQRGHRHEAHISSVLGAVKAHLFDVELRHQNTLFPSEQWIYCKIPHLIIKDLGKLLPPADASLPFYRRQYFSMFAQLPSPGNETISSRLIEKHRTTNLVALAVVQRIAREVADHNRIRDYENEFRQALLPGPFSAAMEKPPPDTLESLTNGSPEPKTGSISDDSVPV